jgi:Putative restriction endonuclease
MSPDRRAGEFGQAAAEPPGGTTVQKVTAPNDRWQEVRQKIAEYVSIGASWVWIVEPENRAVLVFGSSTDSQQVGAEEMVVGEGPLEGFTLPGASLFTA